MKIPKVIQNWADTIAKRNPKLQLSLYCEDAVLVPTYGVIAKGKAKILPYFNMFLDKPNLKCEIVYNETIDLCCGMKLHNGYYSFDFTNEDGIEDNVLARYTFVTNKRGLILTQHSSEQPIVD